MTRAEGGRVVLVHGLWMNALAMLPMAWGLERCGFKVARYGYRSVRRGLDDNVRRLAAVCERAAAPLHLAGHSLRGLVNKTMMRAYTQIAVGRAALVRKPFAHCSAGAAMGRYSWSRGLLGQTREEWLHKP